MFLSVLRLVAWWTFLRICWLQRLELVPTYRDSADTKKYLEEACMRIGRRIRELKVSREPEGAK
jgi:hypothetical protein